MKAKVTAAELMSRLKSDPNYVSLKRNKKEDAARSAEAYARAEAPLVQDLRDAGARIASVWDLVNTTEPYPQLLPILFAHLNRPYPQKILEGIVRALAVPESLTRWNELVDRYLVETDVSSNGLKWALHLAIAAAADVTVVDTLIRLLCDRRHGRNRALFVDALARMDDPGAEAALAELASDPDLAGDVERVTRTTRRR